MKRGVASIALILTVLYFAATAGAADFFDPAAWLFGTSNPVVVSSADPPGSNVPNVGGAPVPNLSGASGSGANGSPAPATSAGGAPNPLGGKGNNQPKGPFSLFDPQTWPFSLIPVPEVATDPNGGTTIGVLPVLLFNDDNNQIRNIIAPDINYNTDLGAGGNFRYLSYPSEDTQWYAVAGAQQNIARKIDVDYQTGRTRQHWLSFEGRFFFEKDPTERFYGIGNDSTLGNQTNYTTKQFYGEAIVGLNFTENLQLSLMERPRQVRIQGGAFNTIPSIFQLFPAQKGINGGSEVLNQMILSYDTRDSLEIPRKGGVATAYAGIVDRSFGSSFSYTRFGGELRRYLTLNKWITFAGHTFIEYEPAGSEMPFWSQARLGGDESLLIDQQTLRGYGAGRFIDNNLFVANIEARTRVYERDIFGTHGIVELAPFFETGRVAHSMDFNPLSQLHSVGGIGFRGIAEPFVVGYVDVGFGGEGAAIFSGINYPF